MAETIFEKIIHGKIPCHKIYEDEKVFSFLDINPVAVGHTLIVPKEAVDSLDQLSDESAAAIGRALPRICRAVIRATGISQYNVLQNNGPLAHQAVPHVHFHIIPKPGPGEGMDLEWPARSLDPKSGEKLAAKIREELKK